VTEDGVRLHVEEVGPPDADLTVVLVHGYVQEMAVWHYQRQALQAAGDVRGRAVRPALARRSSRGAAERSTIDQLGRDLGRGARRGRARPDRSCSSATPWAA
jgi:pimeloyl-ACP methyl ester carboxylesterase